MKGKAKKGQGEGQEYGPSALGIVRGAFPTEKAGVGERSRIRRGDRSISGRKTIATFLTLGRIDQE